MIPIITTDTPHPYPPRVTDFTRRFWDALSEGRFTTTRGVDSGQAAFPPKPISPENWNEEIEWFELSGKGTLYSHTTIYAAPTAFIQDLPYKVCIVDLDENIRLATRFIGEVEPEVGQRVEIVGVKHSEHMSYAARAVS